MSTPVALRVSADVVRLYRILRANGVDFACLRPRGSTDSTDMRRLALRLMARALRQTVPEATVTISGMHLTCTLAAPVLAEHLRRHHWEPRVRLERHYSDYNSPRRRLPSV